MGDSDVWPVLLDMSRDDSKRILRRLELEAYSNLVSVLRAQGSLTAQKRRLLQNVAQTLSISEERHKAECRRAVNSEKLATIAKHMGGANSGTEWAIEGRRLVPLLPRLVPQTAFTAIADKVANMAMTEGAKLPLPTPPVRKRMTSPPIDEALLEPNVPEASKTSQISSASPLSLSSPNSDQNPSQVSACPVQFSPVLHTPLVPVNVHQSPVVVSQHQPKLSTNNPSPTNHSLKTQVKQEVIPAVLPMSSSISPVSSSQTHSSASTSQSQASQSSHAPTQPQVVLCVKKDDKSQDECVSRKRPRSASLDLSLVAQGSMMPPPVKKEALSPLSPPGTSSHLTQPTLTISPQSHSQLVQQQTLQAAAAAAAAVATPATSFTSRSQPTTFHQQQLPLAAQPTTTQTLPGQFQQQQSQQQNLQQAHQTSATPQTSLSSSSSRTLNVPSQGTVKLSLSSTLPSTTAGIPSGTHKVIIVSNTTPSILQRSLSVPVVKSLSTSAPSQPCSTLVLNTTQQSKQPTISANVTSSSADTTTNVSPNTVLTSAPSKPQGKTSSQITTKVRHRTNSIVIPVTPNQANVMNSVGVTSMQLKSALQAGKQAVLKTGDTTGLKIMPIANLSSNAKILPKTHGSGPIYVVSSTSTSSPSVPMVTRTVPSGTRVMTFTSSLPKAAVSASQGAAVLSMTSKPVQTLQLAQASSVTSPGSTSLSSTAGKPNVIVVQKGNAAFGRGVTLSHAGKEVVGKVLLGSKALTSLNQNQLHGPSHTQATHSASQSPAPSSLSAVSSQVAQSQTSRSSTPPQPSQPVTTSAPAKVFTLQKLPSGVVQASCGSGNCIVLDLSLEQLNNSAVLNEILSSSILQSNNVLNFNNDSVSNSSMTSANSVREATNISMEQSEIDSGLLNNDESISVESVDQAIVNHSDINTITIGGDVASEYSVAAPESAGSFFEDDSTIHGEPSSCSGSSIQPSRGCSDIFTTALSNANLNLNDFMDDSSLDGIQPNSVGVTEEHAIPDSSSNCNNSKVESWVSDGISNNSVDDPDTNEV